MEEMAVNLAINRLTEDSLLLICITRFNHVSYLPHIFCRFFGNSFRRS